MDPFRRQTTDVPAVAPGGVVQRNINKLLRRRDQQRRGGGVFTQYLARYDGLGAEYDAWLPVRDIPPEQVRRFEAAQAMLDLFST